MKSFNVLLIIAIISVVMSLTRRRRRIRTRLVECPPNSGNDICQEGEYCCYDSEGVFSGVGGCLPESKRSQCDLQHFVKATN
jgi:hypothetical protein